MTIKNLNVLSGLLALLFLASCGTSKKIAVAEPIEERNLPELVVEAPAPEPKPEEPKSYKLPRYNPSYKRTHDLLHTKLDLRFDWQNSYAMGKAELTLAPLFYASNKLRLDAKNFDLKSITLNGKELTKKYNGNEIFIELDRMYKKGEKYTIKIDYVAKPNERKAGGSAAITQDKGLYFINPKGETPNKPTQIWTQGETESNSAWFPTIDKPNERCTQEMNITVENKYQVLSNGTVTGTKRNSDGTTTHSFKMDKPHAPYLFMMAIGEFYIQKDSWNGIPLEYWVEKDYKESAKAIFNHTPEMLTFFSNKLGVKYPWSKYSQVVVRDYVSGAMENTTGVIFGDFVQKTNRELIDNNNDRIVAHEMIHHWFGDLVTCESWANLTMNEGFANYSEYMWFEHKYGRDAGEFHRMNELEGYLGGAERGSIHDLIYFGYDDKEDMFDGHSYNKGGAVLHMLRKYLGDEAFYASLKLYLERHQYSAVEAHDLRLAFEDTTGEDLNWFWNQWYFDKGQPEVEFTYSFDAAKSEVVIKAEQKQDPEKMPAIFILPFDVSYTTTNGSKAIVERFVMDKRIQEFRISNLKTSPASIVADAENTILGRVKHIGLTDTQYLNQYSNQPILKNRLATLKALKGKRDNPKIAQLFKNALKDNFWVIRNSVLNTIEMNDPEVVKQVKLMAQKDAHSAVRASALEKLGEIGLKENTAIVASAINDREAYGVVGAALGSLAKLDKTEAFKYASKMEDEKHPAILNTLADMYVDAGDASKMGFFEKNLSNVTGFGAMNFFGKYKKMVDAQENVDVILASVDKLSVMAMDMTTSPWTRYASTKTINDFRTDLRIAKNNEAVSKLTKVIDKIRKAETVGQLKQMYMTFQ